MPGPSRSTTRVREKSKKRRARPPALGENSHRVWRDVVAPMLLNGSLDYWQIPPITFQGDRLELNKPSEVARLRDDPTISVEFTEDLGQIIKGFQERTKGLSATGNLDPQTMTALATPDRKGRARQFAAQEYENTPGLPDTATAGSVLPEVGDIERIQREAAARAHVATTASFTDAERVADIRKMWPTIPPKAVATFAKEGLNADDPNVAAAALLGAKREATNRKNREQAEWLAVEYARGNRQPNLGGSPVWRQHQKIVKDKGDQPPPAEDGDFFDDVYGAFKAVSRTAFGVADAAYREPYGVARSSLGAGLGLVDLASRVASDGGSVKDAFDAQQAEKTAGGLAPSPIQSAMSHPLGIPNLTQDLTSEGYFGPQSELGVKLESQITGEGPTDWGSGFFPNPHSPVGREAASRARRALSVHGEAATLGRLVSYGAQLDPDSAAYRVVSGAVDATALLKGDPSIFALKGLGAARRNLKTFDVAARQEAGLFSGLRDLVDGRQFGDWVSNKGRSVVDHLAANTSFDEAYKIVGDPHVAAALTPRASWLDDAGELVVGDAIPQSADEVADILRHVAGTKVNNVPTLPGQRLIPGWERTRVTKPDWRILGLMPRNSWLLSDADELAQTGQRLQLNAKLPAELMEENNWRLATAATREEVSTTIFKIEADIERHLLDKGVGGQKAHSITRLFHESWEEGRKYAIESEGHNWQPSFLHVDGEPRAIPTSVLDDMGDKVPILWSDVREIRQLTGMLAPLYRNPKLGFAAGAAAGAGAGLVLDRDLDGAIIGATLGGVYGWKPNAVNMALDFFTGKVFKPAVLATRIAYPVRIIGEEQFRMAGSGFESFWKHPLSAIAWMTGRKGTLTHADIRAVADDAARAPSEYQRAMSVNPIAATENPTTKAARLKARTVYTQGDEHYASSWVEEVAKRHEDPVARTIANEGTESAKDWFWDGAGREWREKLGSRGGGWAAILDDRRAANAYIQEYWDDVLAPLTGGNAEVRAALATGTLADGSKLITTTKVRQAPQVSKAAVEKFWQFGEDGVGPAKVPGDIYHLGGKAGDAKYDRAVEFAFTWLMGKRTDYLSRSPVFRQSYWHRVAQMSPLVDAEDAARLAAKAEKALTHPVLGLRGDAKKIVESIRERGATAGRVADDAPEARRVPALLDDADPDDGFFRSMGHDLDFAPAREGEKALKITEVDTLAKAYALDTTRELLYDLTERSQLFDVLRLLIPFGDAWKEVVTRWGKILSEHPEAAQRFNQGLRAGRESGFFYTDPNGQEVFNYPLTEQLTKGLFGVPIPLTGSLNGLNLIGNIFPGAGPVVQIPAQWFLPDKPEWDWARGIIFPFGQPAKTGFVSTVSSALTPAWFDKIETWMGDPQFDRAWSSTVLQVDAYLATTGEYGFDTDEINRRLKDAKAKAKNFILFRAAAQNILPSAPIPNFQVHDKDGTLVAIAALRDELHELEAEDYETAAGKFIDKHGDDAYGVLAPLTRSLTYRLPFTKKQVNWERSNPEVVDSFPLTYGFFAPSDPDGEPDFTAFDRQMRSGQRDLPDQFTWQRIVGDRIASNAYERAERKAFKKAGLDPDDLHASITQLEAVDPDEAANLRKFDEDLVAYYEGYKSRVGLIGKPTADEMVRELRRSLDVPKLAKSEQGKALKYYLGERDEVERVALEQHGIKGWETANATEDLRRDLARVQKYARKRWPESAALFDIVFRNDIGGI